MRLIAAIILLSSGVAAIAQNDPGFSGTWKFNAARSELRGLPASPDPFLKVDQNAKAMTISAGTQESGPFTTYSYPLDGGTTTWKAGDFSMSTQTKWEGAALLVNTLASGPQNHTVMERWRKSRDGNTLTIRRTVVRMQGESESTLFYTNTAAVDPTPAN